MHIFGLVWNANKNHFKPFRKDCIRMKKRSKALLTSFTLGALAIAIGFAVQAHVKLRQFEMAYEANYRRAVNELVTAANNIDTSLSKGLYSNSPSMLVTLTSEIWRQSEVAKNALSELPASDISLDKTSVFLSQVGDFSYMLARKAAAGQQITPEERTTLAQLSDTASHVSAELQNFYVASEQRDFFKVQPAEAKAKAEAEEQATKAAQGGVAGGLSAIEESMPESPVLIYDGPYSDHITRRTPKYIELATKQFTEAEARRVASEFLSIGEESLQLATQSEEGPKTYSFETGQGFIVVTGDGGHVMYYSSGTVPGAATISPEQAMEKAAAMLKQRGFADMQSSYYYNAGGVCYINFAYAPNGVMIYPDLLQVGIAMDTGDVAYWQALGYWNNHRTDRKFEPKLTAEEAQGYLGQGLTVEKSNGLCIIPSPGQNEILAYEFLCKGENGKSYLVYINAETGAEESIFILVVDESGTLTM
jgi:spore germination protein